MGLTTICAALSLFLCVAAPAAETNAVRTIFKGNFSGLQEEKQLVITNRADWEALWKQHGARKEPKDPPPKVDFEKESVIVAAQGQKRSGGYSIEIADVRRAADKTEILIRTKSPKPGALTIQALTAPIHIAAVPRIQGKVQFKPE